MPEAVALHLVVADLDDELRPDRRFLELARAPPVRLREASFGRVLEQWQLDRERVLVLCQGSGRGKTSGLELGHTQTQAVNVFHLRAGKVSRLVVYFNREQGLADLGLKE